MVCQVKTKLSTLYGCNVETMSHTQTRRKLQLILDIISCWEKVLSVHLVSIIQLRSSFDLLLILFYSRFSIG